jgi:glucan phosphoethanolaminetransferase (alkaline phosphatase superfamily)
VCWKISFLLFQWCRLCEILSRLISTLSSLINRCRSLSRSFSRRIRNRNVVKNVSSFWSRILFSNASLTWVVSFAIVASVSMLFAWLYECR